MNSPFSCALLICREWSERWDISLSNHWVLELNHQRQSMPRYWYSEMNIYGLFPYRFEFYRKSSSKPKLDFSNAGKPLYDTIWNKTDACSTFGNLAENNDEQTIVHPMIEYLYKWKEDRANWKFKKAKQVFWTLFLCDWTILFRLCCCSTCTTPESWQRMISRSCSSISVIWRYTTPHWCLDS